MIYKSKRKGLLRFFSVMLVVMMMFGMMSVMAFASGTGGATGGTNIFTWAKGAFNQVYGDLVAISTTVACCMAAVALLVMNFSSSGKAVDEARSWFKRVLICWVILNVLGFIMAYLQTLVGTGGSTIV